MFYHFSQNNSGGSFHLDEEKGITRHVIIESDKASQANYIAEEIGIYFDGYGDCVCCGNRWYPAEEYHGEEFPHVYGSIIERHMSSEYFSNWIEEGKEICVHYKDGRKEWF